MAKYAKPRRSRLGKKGLTSLLLHTPDDFPPKKIQKGERRLEEIIQDQSFDEGSKFLRRYILTVCQFRFATGVLQDTSLISREIDRMEDEAHNLGFSQEELGAFNRIIRDKTPRELENIQQGLKERVGVK